MKIRHMRIAYWIPKATNTHLEYVILIAFPLQQQFHARTSLVTLPVHYLSFLLPTLTTLTTLTTHP